MWLDYTESVYKIIEDKVGVHGITDFNLKKKLTSALRRILPNGQANEIGFTLNLRSLRHTITMRTNRHAEWEIRCIFNQIYDLVREKYPAIFSDAKTEEIDNLKEVTFSTVKI